MRHPAEPWRGFLAAALVIGLARFHRLGEWSLWFDEAVTVADGWHGEGVTNPFGYALVRACAAWLGGTDPHALRLPAAVAGYLAIPLTWWAFRTWAGDRRAAIASLWTAASSWALYWSQNARFYTMALAVGLLGTGLLLRGLDPDRPARTSVPRGGAGLLFVALAAGFHPTALLLLGALVAGAPLARLRGEAGRAAHWLLLVGLVLGLAASPWAWGAFRRFVAAKDTAGVGSVLHLARSTGFFLTPALATAALVGALCAWRDGARGRLATLVPLLGGAAAAVAAVLATSSAQYVFVLLPNVCLLAAWPLTSERVGRGAQRAWVWVIAAPLVAGSGLYFGVRHGERPRWREAYALVADRRGERDLVLGMQASVGEYYLDPGATDLRHPVHVAWLERTSSHAWKIWSDRERPLWVVLRPAFLELWAPDERAELEAFLRERCRLVERFPVDMEARDLDVEVWRRP